MQKRGLTHQEAIDYIGVKRRTFDEVWRPRLTAMRQGSCIIFDRHDIDKLFDEFKAAAAAAAGAPSPMTSVERAPVPPAPQPKSLGRYGSAKAPSFEKVAASIFARSKQLKPKR